MDAADGIAAHFRIERHVGSELGAHDRGVSGFIFGTLYRSAGLVKGEQAEDAIRAPGVVVLVAYDLSEGVMLGWLAAKPAENRIVYAYTKHAYRASPEQRHAGAEDGFRIASTLAIAAGIHFDADVRCSFWSRSAEGVFAKPGNPYRLLLTP